MIDIREAYNELLEDNHWMDEETRMVAKEKVGYFEIEILRIVRLLSPISRVYVCTTLNKT